MTKPFAVVIEKNKGLYTASVPQLAGCHVKSKTLNQLIKKVNKAIKRYLKMEKDIPKSDFIGIHVVELNSAKKFTVAIEKSGKDYIASIPSFPGCFTQARSINDLIKYIKEVITLCLDTGAKPVKTDFVGVQLIEV